MTAAKNHDMMKLMGAAVVLAVAAALAAVLVTRARKKRRAGRDAAKAQAEDVTDQRQTDNEGRKEA